MKHIKPYLSMTFGFLCAVITASACADPQYLLNTNLPLTKLTGNATLSCDGNGNTITLGVNVNPSATQGPLFYVTQAIGLIGTDSKGLCTLTATFPLAKTTLTMTQNFQVNFDSQRTKINNITLTKSSAILCLSNLSASCGTSSSSLLNVGVSGNVIYDPQNKPHVTPCICPIKFQ